MTFFHAGDTVGAMSRPWRTEFRGALYHVLSRGNQQGNLFIDDEDRNNFIRLMGEISSRFKVDVFAYVLMDNTIISCFVELGSHLD